MRFSMGALTGSIMAVGIKYAPNEAGVEKRAQTYTNAKTLYNNLKSSMEPFSAVT